MASITRNISKLTTSIVRFSKFNPAGLTKRFEHAGGLGSTGAGTGFSKHKPSNWEKTILVFTRTYPSKEAVPENITIEQMKRARDYFRIRVNVYMGIATLVGCLVMIYFGRRASHAGDSIQKRSVDSKKEYYSKLNTKNE